jgi:ParB family transcriptional regulator, chromosome partitioning protein
MNHQFIEVNKLSKSPLNVRRTVAKGTADDLKASILAHRGLMHNLVVTESGDGMFHVIDGGRRLEAIKALQAEGRLPADYAVPCQVRTGEHALEDSLAANTIRLAMHPADEFEAFARLAEGGDTPEQIGQRFGRTAKHVEQRLKLGNADPKLLKAYRAEELTLDCLMAFALTDDRKRQMKVYRSLKDGGSLSPRSIRAALTGEMAEAGSKLAKFVGLDAYREAGGTTQSDLFSDAVYLENPALLNDLADQKLAAARQQLEAEGWGWVVASPELDWEVIHSCGRIYPQRVEVPAELAEQRQALEQELEAIAAQADDNEGDDDRLLEQQDAAEARLAEIDATIEALDAYDPDHVAIAGCYVSIAHDGSLSIEKGLVRKGDMRRLATPEDAPAKKPKGMPQTLKRDLEAYRLQVAQAEIAKNRLVALDLLVFTLSRNAFVMPSIFTGPDARCIEHAPAVKEATAAGHAFEAIKKELPLAWLKPKAEAEQFRAFTGLSDNQKLDLLAFCVASSLKPQLATGKEATAYELALSLTDAEVAGYWRPAAANYLSRITRDELLALGREVLGEEWAQLRRSDKKGLLVAQLERAFAEPEKHARNAEQLEKLTRWLPEGMAFTAIAAKPKAKKNARKAA